MRCEVARELYSARLDGELSSVEEADLDAHLAACASCTAHALGLAHVHRRSVLQPAPAVPDLSDAILARHRHDRAGAGSPRRRGRVPRLVAVAVAAAMLLLAAGLGTWVRVGGHGAGPLPRLHPELAEATAAPRGGAAAVYLALRNDGGRDELVGVSSGDAGHAVLHASHADDGVVVMQGRASYRIAAEGTSVFQPGGAHVMLLGLRRDLGTGDQVVLDLHFARAGHVEVVAHVVAAQPLTSGMLG